MALRLRYEIDTPARLREHLHLVDGAGYFFFPGVGAAQKTRVVLEISFTATDQSALLRGHVWARPAVGGVWLELRHAAQCLDRLEASPRNELRIASDQLVLAQCAGSPAMLCRLCDVSPGGARLAADTADLGAVGTRVRVALPEAGPTGAQLEAFGRLVWAGEGQVGVEWIRGDLASRAAVRRMLEMGEQDWECARSAAHSQGCRCMRRQTPRVLLLG
jgi:PilZ domain-containing protein